MISTESERVSSLVEQAEGLCDQGLYLEAQNLLPSLQALEEVSADLVRARILGHLGDRRRSEAVVLRTWRRHRSHPQALVDMLRNTGIRGPYRTWLALRRWPLPPGAAVQVQAEYLSLKSVTLSLLRDFEQAERGHQEAIQLNPNDPWLRVEYAHSLELADRYAESIEQTETALKMRPGYLPAIQQLADLYLLVGRENEALALLADAAGTHQSGSLCAAWHSLAVEKGQLDAAQKALVLCERYWPRADKPTRAWIAARRCDLAMLLQDKTEAAAQARLVGSPYHDALAARLETTDTPQRRVELAVGFVRQHHLTCAPATLTALCQYWGWPADHLSIAEEICYDGTPHHSERHWAESQGLWVREFTVTWEVSQALLDAGVPFTVTSVATMNAHLQAVIGYDAWRGSLLIRDPFKRIANEFEVEAFFKSQAPNGPRGMIILPPEQAHRVAHVELPDRLFWNGYHRVMHALSHHDRAAAMLSAAALNRMNAKHRLTLNAQRALAMYDRDDVTLLRLTEQALVNDAYEPNAVIHKASLLTTLGSRAQCEAWWDEVMTKAGFDPIMATRYVQFLMENGRMVDTAARWLHQILTVIPSDGAAWYALGGVHWFKGEHEQALDCFRLASCLQFTHEPYAQAYVSGTRIARRSEEGLNHLRRRCAELGLRSAAPWITLFNQLDLIELTAQGFESLAEGLQLRPTDPDLLLFAAEAELRRGHREAGLALLERARPVAKRAAWLRCRVIFLRDEGLWAQAVELAKEAATLEPFNIDTHRLVANGLWHVESRQSAIDYLRQMASRHPHHFELQRLLLAYLPQDPVDDVVEHLDHMLSINPVDAWTHREKAYKLAQGRRLVEALEHARTALELAPQATQSHAAMAFVRRLLGELDLARQHLRDALTLTVDNDYALAALVDIETTREGRLNALQFIKQALLDQVTTGEGLLGFQEQARAVMDADEVLNFLQEAHRQRPDLWQSWSALASHLNRMGRCEESLALLNQALSRFALLPRLYADRAQTLLLMQQRDGARESLKQALQLSPAWAWPVRLYVDSVADEGHDFERALPVLQAALQRQPAHADLRALHGWLQWRLGHVNEALGHLQEAVALDPDLRWAWDVLQRVGQDALQPAAAEQAAEKVVQARPGDVVAWLRLSEFATTPQRAMQAAERGVALEPRHHEMVARRLHLLMQAQRDEEVLSYLKDTPWGNETPSSILVFKARVEYKRGQTDEALGSLRAVLARDPDNAGLWRELAEWLSQLGRTAGYVDAAQQLVRIAPQSAQARGYLGHALKIQGQKGLAELEFTQALALDPSYRFAALELVDIAMDQQLWHQAEERLQALERQEKTPLVALRLAQCAAATGQRQLTIDKTMEVLTTRDVHPELSRAAVDCVARTHWSVYLAEAIEEALKKGPCSREAVRFWIDHQGDGWMPGAFYRDMRKALKSDPSDAVKHGLLLWLAEKKNKALLNRFVKEYDGDLRRHTESWSLTGYAYINQGRYADAARWMSDWESRKDIPSWSLDNIAYCYRKLGRHPEAAEATTWSLSIEPNNPEASVWLAFDAGRKGQLVELEKQLERLKGAEIRPYYAHLQRALSAYLNAARTHDSAAALWHFGQLQAEAQQDKVLRMLLKELAQRLLAVHTPGWKRPWRWLQFRMGWS